MRLVLIFVAVLVDKTANVKATSCAWWVLARSRSADCALIVKGQTAGGCAKTTYVWIASTERTALPMRSVLRAGASAETARIRSQIAVGQDKFAPPTLARIAHKKVIVPHTRAVAWVGSV